MSAHHPSLDPDHHNPEMESKMRQALEKLGPGNPLAPQPAMPEQSRHTLSLPHLGQGRFDSRNFNDRPRRRFVQEGEVPVHSAQLGPRHDEGAHRQAMNAMLATQVTLERERDDLRKERDDQKEVIARLRTRIAHSEHALGEANARIEKLQEQLATAKSDLQTARATIDQLQSRLARAALRTEPSTQRTAPLVRSARIPTLATTGANSRPAPSPAEIEDRIAAFADLPDSEELLPSEATPRRRGRPPGSANKHVVGPPKSVRSHAPISSLPLKARSAAAQQPVQWWLKK